MNDKIKAQIYLALDNLPSTPLVVLGTVLTDCLKVIDTLEAEVSALNDEIEHLEDELDVAS